MTRTAKTITYAVRDLHRILADHRVPYHVR